MALQSLVSGDKFRYQLEGYDLDLTFILPNLIAMGVPGEGLSSQWRNNIHDVSRFFNTKYGTKYRIWNLTGEPYNYTLFNQQVVEFGFRDHTPPPIKLLWDCVLSIHQWLSAAEDHMAAVHCLAGRSRTGCIITAYLLYCHKFTSATQAISFFNETRSKDGQNIVLPSQIRFVKYFEQVLRSGMDLRERPKKLLLKTVTISPVLPLEGSTKSSRASMCPFIEIVDLAKSVGKEKFCFGVTPKGKEYWKSDNIATIRNINAVVEGDVEIIFHHFTRNAAAYAKTLSRLKYNLLSTANQVSEYPNVVLFRYIFHTSFIDPSNYTFTVDPSNLDAPHAGPVITSEWIPIHLRVTFEFEPIDPTPNSPPPPRPSTQPAPPPTSHNSSPPSTSHNSSPPPLPPYHTQPSLSRHSHPSLPPHHTQPLSSQNLHIAPLSRNSRSGQPVLQPTQPPLHSHHTPSLSSPSPHTAFPPHTFQSGQPTQPVLYVTSSPQVLVSHPASTPLATPYHASIPPSNVQQQYLWPPQTHLTPQQTLPQQTHSTPSPSFQPQYSLAPHQQSSHPPPHPQSSHSAHLEFPGYTPPRSTDPTRIHNIYDFIPPLVAQAGYQGGQMEFPGSPF